MSCQFSEIKEESETVHKDWKPLNRLAKEVNNITYIFPADVSLELRDSAIQMSEDAIQKNLELLGEEAFTDTIRFEFVHTRKDMELASGRNVKGLAIPYLGVMYSLLDLSETSPIQHELMHMITDLNWRRPYSSIRFLNEGLATYAGGMCGKYNFDELYYYYVLNDLIIPIDSLTQDFYNQDEILGYSQGAYIVKYLSENFGWNKVKELWVGGFSQFETVFGRPFEAIQKEMNKKLEGQFPEGVEVDWESIKEGCPE
jgi:hypothetical protein